MPGAPSARCIGALCAISAMATLASPAKAIEFWEDRISIHGFYEQQIRSIVRDFSFDDDWDLSQWYHVVNLEIEADVARDGWGPFDMVSAFGRIEVRYDCVWNRGCGLFSSANAYGDRARRLPGRLLDGRREGYTMQEFTGDTRRFREYASFKFLSADYHDYPTPARSPLQFGFIPGITGLSPSKGGDGVLGTADDPFPYYTFGFMNPDDCRFGIQGITGSNDLVGTRTLPITPACKVRPIAPLANRANPLRSGDINPITGQGGMGALPLRPAPKQGFGGRWGRGELAQGVWYPNHRLAELLREGEFDNFDQNFRQAELEWNRGASQQDEKELKELYLDLEMFDNRLWLRLGKQTIVWGKTELFRNQDQWNPQDLGLASLPSLEESRIALWAVRAIWSFYSIGPLEDVRLELAMNYDQFEPIDIGRCGEPYAVLPGCDKTWGLMAHGFTGQALAGEIRPPDPWNSWKGIEVGGRLEFRWDRLSFALTDFYGYSDGGWVEPIFRYSRNVDPQTGRPRWGMNQGRCQTGRESACLTAANALTHHSVAQTLFNFLCAANLGVPDLDPTACGLNAVNSQERTITDPLDPLYSLAPRFMVAFTNMLAGPSSLLTGGGAGVAESLGGFNTTTITALNAVGGSSIPRYTSGSFGPLTPTPLVPLVADPQDGGSATLTPTQAADLTFQLWVPTGLQPVLTDEQEALLGCGPFYGTQCDIDGIDLMNMEASATVQSWPLTEGTFGPGLWDTTDGSRRQPGTVGFPGGPVCTRYERGQTFILPGCRGPGDKHYNIGVDGSTGGAVHPFTGQTWSSEMAVLSWNMLMALTLSSTAANPDNPRQSEFDPNRPFRKSGCSLAAPVFCASVAGYQSITGVQRRSVLAGGDGRYGRRDFIWHGGGDVALRYAKRNVLGFSLDFAEDVSKSNWSVEFTWVDEQPFANANSFDANSEAETFNLTVSVDRSTFVNFLNPGRTFAFNTQWFFQYVDGYVKGFFSDGPWNVLTTFTIFTGYFQDRMIPGVTFVYDFQSGSGAVLPQVTYRFTNNFSATFGVAGFYGRTQEKTQPFFPVGISNQVGRGAYKSFVDNGFSGLRERDEFYLRIRYTF